MNIANLTELLHLEQCDTQRYQGISWDLGFRALYGGQVLSQAIMAAYQTVAPDRLLHSLHSYFLLPGDANQSVIYDVENLRDGGSFSTRRVRAIQNDKTLFFMTASFQMEELGLFHQYCKMTDTQKPQNLPSDIEFYEENPQMVPKKMRAAMPYHKTIDIRTIGGVKDFAPIKNDAARQLWLKSGLELPTDDIAIHQAALAYASDYHFLGTSLKAHGISIQDPQLRIATIDHAMWFHQKVNFNEWLMYDITSPFSGNGRALVLGKMYDQQGKLMVSCNQEGVVRHPSAQT